MNVEQVSVSENSHTDLPISPTIKLAITLFTSYLFAAIYRYYLRTFTPHVQHMYFVTVGLCMMYFNYGFDTYHSIISTLLVYLILRSFPGTIFAVILAFTYLMGHLLIGYAYKSNEKYDINWVLPQCILTLRLIGLVWDVYDGHHSEYPLKRLRAMVNGDFNDPNTGLPREK